MSKKIFSDRKKYRIVEIIIILLIGILTPLIWTISFTFFQFQSDQIFALQVVTILTAAALFFLFKHWAKAEDERVFLFSQKAARKTIYFFGITLVVLCVLFIWISNKNVERMAPQPPFGIVLVNHTNETFPFQNTSSITVVKSNDTWITNPDGSTTTGYIVNPYPPNTLLIDVWPGLVTVSYPGTNPNDTSAIAQYYGDVATTLLFVAIALWVTYLIFYYYCGRKFGEFGKDHEK